MTNYCEECTDRLRPQQAADGMCSDVLRRREQEGSLPLSSRCRQPTVTPGRPGRPARKPSSGPPYFGIAAMHSISTLALALTSAATTTVDRAGGPLSGGKNLP